MKSKMEEKEPVIKYPCLMIGQLSRCIYLMANETEGTVIHKPDYAQTPNHLGDYVTKIFPENLTLWNGKIELSN